MYTNVNLAAPLGVLALLGTTFVLAIAGLIFAYTIFARKFLGTIAVLLAGAVIVTVYLGLMLLMSFTSGERVLARGQEKHFCEIDCHLAYSIVDVRQTKTLGNPPNQFSASGLFHVIQIKTRFDEDTIGRNRRSGPLKPNSRVATVIDDQGREYAPSQDGQRVLSQSEGIGTPLTTPLRPGESYTTSLVFDLPAGVNNPTLLINEGETVTHLVIGHENSLLHKKTRFQL
ncbi:MAG: hypothetical protein ACR2G5_05035 [Pyrinomonadaceae bacterium]